MKKIILMLLFLSMATVSHAWHIRSERSYQKEWCAENGGQAEVVMSDQTRCDCLTDKYAIEHDFAKKWYEAIGQSLHYARLTGKKAGIVLILEKEKDLAEWEKMNLAIEYFNLPIKTWKIENFNQP